MEYGKLADGAEINTALLDDSFGNHYNYLCESFQYDKDQKKCFSLTYNNETMNPNADGFVMCNRTSAQNECSYTNTFNKTQTMSCQCGYNADGNSYCPLDYQHAQANEKISAQFVASLSGQCHTLNRYNCDVNSNGYQNFVKAQRNAENAHLFYKSVSCAKDVLSRSFINFSVISMMIYALLF